MKSLGYMAQQLKQNRSDGRTIKWDASKFRLFHDVGWYNCREGLIRSSRGGQSSTQDRRAEETNDRKTSNKGGKILARMKTIADREDGHVSKKNQREGNYQSVREDCQQSLKTMWLEQLFKRATDLLTIITDSDYNPATFQLTQNIKMRKDILTNCEVNSCEMKLDSKDANRSDALIIHHRNMKSRKPLRPRGQIWIMIQHEASSTYFKRHSTVYQVIVYDNDSA